jgi:hypothetical protein
MMAGKIDIDSAAKLAEAMQAKAPRALEASSSEINTLNSTGSGDSTLASTGSGDSTLSSDNGSGNSTLGSTSSGDSTLGSTGSGDSTLGDADNGDGTLNGGQTGNDTLGASGDGTLSIEGDSHIGLAKDDFVATLRTTEKLRMQFGLVVLEACHSELAPCQQLTLQPVAKSLITTSDNVRYQNVDYRKLRDADVILTIREEFTRINNFRVEDLR